MRSKIFKTAIIALIGLIAVCNVTVAQDVTVNSADSVSQPVGSADPIITIDPVTVNLKQVKVKLHKLKVDLKDLNVSANADVTVAINNLTAELNTDLKDLAPQISLNFKEGADITHNSDDDGDLIKNYSKTYSIDGNDAIAINNKFGKVTVITWAQNEVKVDVQIKASASDPDVAHKLLDYIKINDSKYGNNVNFTTDMDFKNSYWKSNFVGDGGHSMEVNYTVYMPAKNDLTINNQYGPITIPDMDGKVTINDEFGSFKGGVLSKESDIRVKYGNADIQSVGTCAIEVGYGALNLGSADKIAANISYSGIKIGKLHDSGSINMRYGDGLQIDDLDRNVKSLAVNSSYANVNIGLSGDEIANFAVVTHYGDFNYDGRDVTITEKSPDDSDGHPHFTKSYKGYLGKSASNKTIAINVNYGNVKFQ